MRSGPLATDLRLPMKAALLLVCAMVLPATTRAPLPSITAPIPACTCVPTLSVSDNGVAGCFHVAVSVGLPQSQAKCNSHAGCTELVPCDAAPGTASCTVAWSSCSACSGPVEIFLNGQSQGTISVGSSAALLVSVGGDLTACTGSGESEGQGDLIRFTCPGLPFPAEHVFEVKDGCSACTSLVD